MQQQKCTFSLITQDKTEVVVPADFMEFSDMLSDYVKMWRKNNGGTEDVQAKFDMTNEMPFISKEHLDLIFTFLRTYQNEMQQPKEGTTTDEAAGGDQQEMETPPQEWAFNLFSNVPKNDLFLAMNGANYFGIRPFVSLSTAFVCSQIWQKKVGEVAAYLNMDESNA